MTAKARAREVIAQTFASELRYGDEGVDLGRDVADAILAALSDAGIGLYQITKKDPWPSVAWFGDMMRRELTANQHKTGWEDCSPRDLQQHCFAEAFELRDLVRDYKVGTFPCDYDQIIEHDHEEKPLRIAIISECADVANMAMMIADVVRALPPHAAQPAPATTPAGAGNTEETA